jgi:hypothetical protein
MKPTLPRYLIFMLALSADIVAWLRLAKNIFQKSRYAKSVWGGTLLFHGTKEKGLDFLGFL